MYQKISNGPDSLDYGCVQYLSAMVVCNVFICNGCVQCNGLQCNMIACNGRSGVISNDLVDTYKISNCLL